MPGLSSVIVKNLKNMRLLFLLVFFKFSSALTFYHVGIFSTCDKHEFQTKANITKRHKDAGLYSATLELLLKEKITNVLKSFYKDSPSYRNNGSYDTFLVDAFSGR